MAEEQEQETRPEREQALNERDYYNRLQSPEKAQGDQSGVSQAGLGWAGSSWTGGETLKSCGILTTLIASLPVMGKPLTTRQTKEGPRRSREKPTSRR